MQIGRHNKGQQGLDSGFINAAVGVSKLCWEKS